MSGRAANIRRAELIAALSLAVDISTGEQMERAFRNCIVAQRLGILVGLSPLDQSHLYYLSLLKFLGCISDTVSAARVFGDEMTVAEWISPAIPDGPMAIMAAMLRHHAEDRPLIERIGLLTTALTRLPAMNDSTKAHCEVAERLAARMGFDAQFCDRLTQVFEFWNGSGKPRQLKGNDISLPVRVNPVAEDAELFFRLGGVDLARETIGKRAGKAYDPEVTAIFCAHAPQILDGLETASTWHGFLAAEPGDHEVLDEAGLDACLEALADFCDLKSRYFLGHSEAVSVLATNAATILKLPPADVTQVRRAALVHEIGMAGVSSGILEKESPLSEIEQERLRMHVYFTERVLSRPPELALLGSIAAMHHERLDGSGYHKGSVAASQPMGACILSAACAYQTELTVQPDRRARTPEEAQVRLQQEVSAGKLDAEAVAAVLAAAGHPVRLPRQSLPAGLSEREVEVLKLLAQGLSRKEIAGTLVIADKTVAHHIEHIYNKIGSSTRPAATLFALHNGLLRT